MNLLLRNQRIWILPALLAVVFHVHQVECKDDLFRTYFKNKKAGFVRTDGKTYHVQYEVDLNDALQQSERLIKAISNPMVTLGSESSSDEDIEETTVGTEAYRDFNESKAQPNAEEGEEVFDVTEESLVGETVEEKEKEKEEELFTVGKPISKSIFFKKKEDEPSEEFVEEIDENANPESTTEIINSEESATETTQLKDEKTLQKDTDTVEERKSSAKKLKKKFKKPLIVSILKNFKLMFHLPIKLNRFQPKHSIGKKLKDEDDYNDCLVT